MPKAKPKAKTIQRDYWFKVKSFDTQSGAFEGLLAVYNNVDLGGDCIMPGAFTKTLQEHGPQVPLLWQHQTAEPIGILTLTDGPDALSVQGQLLLDLDMAQKALVLLKNKIIKGMSIGYDTIQDSVENGVRYLKELRLWEGSLVTFPMNEQAMVTSVKSFRDAEDLIRSADRSDPEVRKHLDSLNVVLRKFLHKDENCECPCDACVGGDCEDCWNAGCFDPNCEGHTDEERLQNWLLVSFLELAQEFAAQVSALVEQP